MGTETRKVNNSWYALRVRSRFENTVATHLHARGFESFLPLYKCRRRWSDRFKEMELPLFPGYVFCQLNPLNRLPILSVPGVVYLVGVGKTPLPVNESEMAAIHAAVKSGLPSRPWPFLQIGNKVRIEFGPLCGVEGILLGFKGHQRLVLSVSLLQRSVAVQIDEGWVRPLDAERVEKMHDSWFAKKPKAEKRIPGFEVVGPAVPSTVREFQRLAKPQAPSRQAEDRS